MKIQLIVLLLIFNYLGVYASEIAEPVEPAARPLSAARSFLDSMVIRESFIVKLRGDIAGCERVLRIADENWHKKSEKLVQDHEREQELIIERFLSGAIKSPEEKDAKLRSITDEFIARTKEAGEQYAVLGGAQQPIEEQIY